MLPDWLSEFSKNAHPGGMANLGILEIGRETGVGERSPGRMPAIRIAERQLNIHEGFLPALASGPVVTALLFFGFVLLRLPFRAHFPVNWDAVQLALGTQSFDLHHHQPHPPGYIGFIGLGRLINHLTHDPVLSLTLLSIAAGALAPAVFYWYSRNWLGQRHAILTAMLFGLSPLVWYYSAVALSYAAELAAGMALMLVAHRSIRYTSIRDLLIATVLLSVLGSLRQSAMLFLVPVWLYCLWHYPWRARIAATSLMGGLTLLWAAPLVWLSGGPEAYMRESRALADLIGGQTSILAMNFDGLQMNIWYVAVGLLAGLHIGLLVIGIALLAGFRPLQRLSQQDRRFFAIWSLPALLTFLLGHTGQLGYVLLLLPPLFLVLGLSIESLAVSTSFTVRRMATSSTLTIATVSLLIFMMVPGLAYSWARPDPGEQESWFARHSRQYDLPVSDSHWSSMVDLVQRFDPEHTVILTTVGGPRSSGSFRHASYLLPEYQVYGLGVDTSGTFGTLFVAQNGESDYSVEGLHNARPWLRIDRDARWVIIPDAEILAWIHPDLELHTITLDGGTQAAIGHIRPESAITINWDQP